MKKRLFIISVIFVMSFMLYACKTKEKVEKKPNTSKIETEINTDKNIVEDEIILDYKGEEEDDNTTLDSENQKNNANNGNIAQDSGKESITDSTEESASNQKEGNEFSEDNEDTIEGEENTETTQPRNPYDKDGDGFLDGWY